MWTTIQQLKRVHQTLCIAMNGSVYYNDYGKGDEIWPFFQCEV